jgi:hypothetical protein
MNFDFIARLPALRVPTLVVCGVDDPGTPPSENRRLRRPCSRRPLRNDAEAGDLPNVERPEEFNRIIMNWLGAQLYARSRYDACAGRERAKTTKITLFAVERSRWQHITVLVFNNLREKFVT